MDEDPAVPAALDAEPRFAMLGLDELVAYALGSDDGSVPPGHEATA